MAIGKMLTFRQGMKVLDLGTGGGFPGIPLAILFPECQFRLIDGTGKKVMVAQEVIKAIGLDNCEAVHLRGEEERGRYQYVVSRAVMPLPDLVKLVRKNISKEQMGALPNGILVLKGGDVSAEVQPWRKKAEVQDLHQWFPEPWFEEKRLIYLPV
jgi:16S rRNA (guanine527-N7)-methyltransferase